MSDLISTNSSRLEMSMRVMDVGAIYIAGELAGLLHFKTSLIDAAPVHTVLLYFCCALAFIAFPQFDVYSSFRGRSSFEMLARLAVAWTIILVSAIVFSFLIHHVGALSRLWLVYWYAMAYMLLIASRGVAYSGLNYLRKRGFNTKNVIIVGYGSIGQELHKRASCQHWCGYEVKAIHSEKTDAHDPAPTHDPHIVHISNLADIPCFAAANNIHEIWITLPISASNQLLELQYLLRNALLDIRWMPDTMSMQMLSNKMSDFLGFPAVDVNRPRSSGLNGLLKSLLDKIIAATALILLAPLFLVLAICIKYSSPGPIFFIQPRLGLNGKKFNVYKFRSMKLHHENGIVRQATQNDPRMTKIGQFIRRTSLDELPQFINVLTGDMSVVGPRPHALEHNEMYQGLLELYMLRHRVKPGITGWAQIHGYRGETDTLDKMEKRVEFDLQYIQNWSLWMDLKIIAWTAFKGWTGNNAY